MNIAIVEDLQEYRLWLSGKLQEYMAEKHLSYTLYTYSSAEAFIDALDMVKFDIVFMDIYLKNMTGMDAAQVLRQKDDSCKLVFLTGSDEYLRQGYSVNASHYLLKPVSDEYFAEAMENCRISPRYAVPTLDFLSNNVPVQLNTGRIIYIQLEGRKIHIHTPDQVFVVTGTFKNITAPLRQDPRFLQCIQGIMVNMDYISGHEDSLFILKNGEKVPFTLRNRRQILQTYRNYIFETMGEIR